MLAQTRTTSSGILEEVEHEEAPRDEPRHVIENSIYSPVAEVAARGAAGPADPPVAGPGDPHAARGRGGRSVLGELVREQRGGKREPRKVGVGAEVVQRRRHERQVLGLT